MSNQAKLIFFDIDGTLLNTHGTGRRAFIQTLHKVFGWDDEIPYINFSGATDRVVIRRIMENNGEQATEDRIQAFFKAMPFELDRLLAAQPPEVCPGVDKLLQALHGCVHATLGIITGNIEACAWLKLRHAKLDGYFELGAFGDEADRRDDIAALALNRGFGKTRSQTSGPNHTTCYLVGDTPNDVKAAQSIKAFSLATATGFCTEKELQQAGADMVLPNLHETPKMLDIFGISSLS